MKIAIVGGGLQGVETAYLAHHAGWHVTLVDRKPMPPARGLCDRFIQTDVTTNASSATAAFAECDLVLPTLENTDALNALVNIASAGTTRLVFDPRAYAVTSSKHHSNRLFERLGLTLPAAGVDRPGPVIVKPSRGSGSHGVKIFASYPMAQAYMMAHQTDERWICQRYIPGPTFSIEVMGLPGHYRTMAVTDLFMDEVYDCKRVRAPSGLSRRHQDTLAQMARQLAHALSLTGIMDVEVVLHDDNLYLLEIDARIPSQTPTAVFKATGINMIAELGALFTGDEVQAFGSVDSHAGVVYEHVRVDPEGIHSCGEHIMAQAGPLELVSDFFGCEEAITNFVQGAPNWVATLICSGSETADAWRKRCAVHHRIRETLKERPWAA